MERGEGHGHGERGRVGDVECGYAFASIDVFCAVEHGFVHFVRIVDLHALFDDCRLLAGCAVLAVICIPSNGFIRASLAIVAQAPLVAGARC